MKAVLPLALIGALAIGTAYAAGPSQSGTTDQSSMSDQSSMGGQSSMRQQKWSQSQVKQIQSKLKQQGYDVGRVDGVLGPTTQQALRQFQEDKGIQATGQPDQQTLAALDIAPSGTQTGQVPGTRSRMQPPGGSQPPGGTQAPTEPYGGQPSGGSMTR